MLTRRVSERVKKNCEILKKNVRTLKEWANKLAYKEYKKQMEAQIMQKKQREQREQREREQRKQREEEEQRKNDPELAEKYRIKQEKLELERLEQEEEKAKRAVAQRKKMNASKDRDTRQRAIGRWILWKIEHDSKNYGKQKRTPKVRFSEQLEVFTYDNSEDNSAQYQT